MKVSIYNRSAKDSGSIMMRFRLTDVGGVQLFHKSQIEVDVQSLKAINPDGTQRARMKADANLLALIDLEMKAVKKAYIDGINCGQVFTTESFEAAIDKQLHPEKYIIKAVQHTEGMTERLKQFADDALNFGVICRARFNHYKVLVSQFEGYLTHIGNKGITCRDFSADHVSGFRDYLMNVCGCSQNTTTSKLKMLNAFFNELVEVGEIDCSPFARVGRNRKRAMMHTRYDEPFFLTADELRLIMAADVNKSLRETKDAFCLQCMLGCRVGDFSRLTMDNVSIAEDGFAYVHYLPEKTKGTQSDNSEIETPLMQSAFEIIQKYSGFNFRVLNYVFGQDGYNVKIKELLKACGITRKVAVYDHEKGVNNYTPICDVASSKLARKTFVDVLQKSQIDLYAAGLHREGSTAVNRYTYRTLKDRFVLMCAAFKESRYKADYLPAADVA